MLPMLSIPDACLLSSQTCQCNTNACAKASIKYCTGLEYAQLFGSLNALDVPMQITSFLSSKM